MTTLRLLPHQEEGVAWMRGVEASGPGGILADDMGLGKTIQALSLARPGESTLVVCPHTLRHQWITELARHFPALVHVVNVLTYDELFRRPAAWFENRSWVRVIFDEAHALKNSRALTHLAALRVRSQHTWLLTGTPICRAKRDLAALSEIVMRAFPAQTSADMSVPLLRRDRWLLKPPPLTIDTVSLEFEDREEREAYGVTWSMFQAACDAGNRGQMLACLSQLRQATARESKRRTLANLVQSHCASCGPGYRALVFTHWHEEADCVVADLTALGLRACSLDGRTKDRSGVIARFMQHDALDVLVVQIISGGAGLNLQRASHVYINTPPWNASTEEQAISRAHRLGCAGPVYAFRLLVSGTVDEYAALLQQRKRVFASELACASVLYLEECEEVDLEDVTRLREMECPY